MSRPLFLIKNIFNYLKHIFTAFYYVDRAVEMAVLSYPPVKKIISTGPVSRNSFTTATIELLCIIDQAYAVAHLTTSLYPKYSSNLECLIRLENKLFLTAPNPKTTSRTHGKIVCTAVVARILARTANS